MELHNRLKEIRQKNDLTQEALAESVEVTRQTIIAIEKGKFGPTVTLALALAQELDVRVEDLFWLEPDHRE
jgi:putative transcriptional regulator